MSTWKDFLSSEIYAKQLVQKDFKFIMVQENDSVHQVLTTLTKNKISSAPILSQDGVIGQVDMLDLVTFIATVFEKGDATDERIMKKIEETPIGKIMNLSGRNKLHTLFSDEHVFKLIRMLAKPNIHRILLSNRNNAKHYDGLVTQSSLLKWIYENKDKAKDITSLTVQDLWPESAGIDWIFEDETLLEAFKTIYDKHVSGLAVLNRNGELVGNISASDLKHAGMNSYLEHNVNQLIKDVKTKISDFLHLKQQQQPTQGSGSYIPSLGAYKRKSPSDLPQFKPIAVSPTDTIEKIMDVLINTKNSFDQGHIHRLYVVDSNKKPIHEISLSDIIAQFQQYQAMSGQ